jgi:hypothetical protein
MPTGIPNAFFPLTAEQQEQCRRNLQDFIRGKKRFIAVRRWVDVQDDEISKRRVAAFICDMLRDTWLNPSE